MAAPDILTVSVRVTTESHDYDTFKTMTEAMVTESFLRRTGCEPTTVDWLWEDKTTWTDEETGEEYHFPEMWLCYAEGPSRCGS